MPADKRMGRGVVRLSVTIRCAAAKGYFQEKSSSDPRVDRRVSAAAREAGQVVQVVEYRIE